MNKINFCIMLIAIALCSFHLTVQADNPQTNINAGLPPLETFILNPIEIEHISIWVPADKVVPTINRSCRPRTNCQYSCELPATVHHVKTNTCPDAQARILAEAVWPYHQDTLPLTIFNGWQWEYQYSLSQFSASLYTLPQRGGCWENCIEAVLTQSQATITGNWISLSLSNENMSRDTEIPISIKSNLEIRTFSHLRTRNGYPKERQLD